MSRYMVVNKSPDNVSKEEYVIPPPKFTDEIKACASKRPRNLQVTPNYLREILAAIVSKYVTDDSVNVLTDFNISRVTGKPCSTDKEVSDLLLQLLYTQKLKVLHSYVDYWFKRRPNGIKFIYCPMDSKIAIRLAEFGWEEMSIQEFRSINKSKNKENNPQQPLDKQNKKGDKDGKDQHQSGGSEN